MPAGWTGWILGILGYGSTVASWPGGRASSGCESTPASETCPRRSSRRTGPLLQPSCGNSGLRRLIRGDPPADPRHRAILDEKTLGRHIKPGAFLAQCARGKLIREEALVAGPGVGPTRGCRTGRVHRGSRFPLRRPSPSLPNVVPLPTSAVASPPPPGPGHLTVHREPGPLPPGEPLLHEETSASGTEGAGPSGRTSNRGRLTGREGIAQGADWAGPAPGRASPRDPGPGGGRRRRAALRRPGARGCPSPRE